MALRTEGNHRYSWMKNQRSLFVSRTRPRSLRRNTIQLMSQHRILGFKSALRLEWRDQNAQDETEQRDHRALTLCDSIRQSMRMRFLVHTGGKVKMPRRCTQISLLVPHSFTSLLLFISGSQDWNSERRIDRSCCLPASCRRLTRDRKIGSIPRASRMTHESNVINDTLDDALEPGIALIRPPIG